MTIVYEIDQLKVSYGDRPVLDIEQFVIGEHESIVLTGANGAGKSTLLNVLAFMLVPASGTLKFFGTEVNSGQLQNARRKIGYVEQRPYLFNTSVAGNIEMGLKLRGMDKQQRNTHVQQIIDHLNLGSIANKRAHELSGGEAQKVALARALVLEPSVLILDEPFTYLDKTASAEFEKLLIELRDSRKYTLILSSHDHLRAQLLADRVCHVIHGRLVEGSVANLLRGRYSGASGCFDTGRIKIKMPDIREQFELIAIEPEQVVLSLTELDSSMRNRYPGTITGLQDRGEQVEVTVNAGERFHALITHAALQDLDITVGSEIWVNFKSSAVRILG